MRKSDLKQFSDLIDERLDLKLDQKLDEKLANFATKDDLKQFATKDDLKSFATKEDLKAFATKKDLDASEERIILTVYKNFKEFEEKAGIKFDKNTEQHNQMLERFDKIDNQLSQRFTKDEIFEKWDNNIDQIKCDVDGLKFIHRDEWKKLPDRATIKSALNTTSV